MPAYRINGKNVLFIHVPKTGGTSVERFLAGVSPVSLHNGGVKLLRPVRDARFTRSLPLQHFHGALLEAMFAPGFFDYAFMIVRDPLDRMTSEYRHSLKLGRIDTRLAFDSWLRLSLAIARAAPNLRNNHYRPQADFICFGAEVFKFEQGVGQIMAQVAERLGVAPPASVPHERRSQGPEIAVSAASRERIRKAYAGDYAKFGY